MDVAASWYVYDGSQVKGPFTLDGLEEIKSKTDAYALSKLMVSKKGLDKWHALSSVDEITRFVKTQDQPVHSELNQLQQTLQVSLDSIRQLDGSTFSPTLQRYSYEYKASPAPRAAVVESIASTVDAQPYVRPARPRIEIIDVPAIMNFRVLRGRLRLGELRSPIVSGLLLPILTVGLYIPYWVRSVYRELNWYSYNDLSLNGLPPFIALCMPIYSCVVMFRLATFIQLSEGQCGYLKTNSRVASILGLIPPLAIFYLQKNLNRLWRVKATQTAELQGLS